MAYPYDDQAAAPEDLPLAADEIGASIDVIPDRRAPSAAPISFALNPSPTAAPPPVPTEKAQPQPALPPGSDLARFGLFSDQAIGDQPTDFAPPPAAPRAPSAGSVRPASDAAPNAVAGAEPPTRYENIALDVLSGDAKRRPTEGDYKALKEATPFRGEDERRAWMRRMGLDPSDTSEQGRRRQEQFLGFEHDLASLGYDQKRLREIADMPDETKRDAARKALFEAARDKIVSGVTATIGRMRADLEGSLQESVNTAQAAASAAQRAEVDDRTKRALAALEAQRRIDTEARARAMRDNQLNSYIVPSTGKVAYLPGYTPKAVDQDEALQARYARQREAILRQHEDALGRLDVGAERADVTAAQQRMRSGLQAFDREARVRQQTAVRTQLAQFNEFLQTRLDDARTPTTDGGLPLPYTNDATQLQDLKTRAKGGSVLSAIPDFSVEVGRGALGAVIGIGQLATAGVDLVFGTSTAAGPQAASDYVNSIADWLESDAMKAQRELQQRAIAEATKGKEGLAAAGAAARAGVTSLGFDRATFGMLGQMAGGFIAGGVAGRAAGMVGGAVGASRAGAAQAAEVLSQVAKPGVLREVGQQAAAAARSPYSWAFAGQAADSASHDFGERTRDLFNDARFVQSNPVLQSLRQQFPSYSEEQLKDLFVRRARSSAAVSGGAATMLTLMIPGLNGVEGQLARIGAPIAELTAVPAATATGARFASARAAVKAVGDTVLAPAASNAAQQGVVDMATAGAASAATGENLFDLNRQAAALGSAGAFGGVVGGGLRMRERSRISAAEALRQPDPGAAPLAQYEGAIGPDLTGAASRLPGVDNPLRMQPAPSTDFVGPMPAMRALPSPEAFVRSDMARVRAEAARIAGDNVDRVPEVQRLLEAVHTNYDAAVGAQVATTLGEHTRSHAVPVPEGSIVHFANPEAHHAWARALATPGEQLIFSTPDGPDAFAVARVLTDDGLTQMRAFDASTSAGLEALSSADPAGPEFQTALKGAAILDGLHRLGVAIETKNRESLDINAVLQDTTRTVAELRRSDLYENGMIDPAVYAAAAVKARGDALQAIADAGSDVHAVLRGVLADQSEANVGAAVMRQFSDDAASRWITDIRQSAIAAADTARADKAPQRQAAKQAQAFRQAEAMIERVRLAVDEMRTALAFTEGQDGVEEPVRRATTKALREVISRPIESVDPDVRAVTLAAVPSVGGFRPGSTRVIDANNPALRSALFDNAVYGLIERMIADPSLSVAQARNLALHLGAGQHAPIDVINAAIAEKGVVQASRAAAARAAQIAHDEVTWISTQAERQLAAMRTLRLPAPPPERATALDLVRDAVARSEAERVASERAILSAETRDRLAYGGENADHYKEIARRRRTFAADFERAQDVRAADQAWEREQVFRGVLADGAAMTAGQAEGARAVKAEARGARTRDGATRRAEAPDGFTLLGQRAATPIDADLLGRIAEAMGSKFRDLKLSFKIVQDDADRGSGGSRGYSALTVNDASGGGVTILLNRDRIATVGDAKRAIWHELYGHFAPEQILGPAKFGRVIETVLGFAERGEDAEAGRFLAEFRREYRDTFGVEPSARQKAAEVLAHLIETNKLQPAALTKRLTDVFAGSNFARNGLTRDDLQFLLDKIVDTASDGRADIEQARAAVLARDSFIEPDHQLRDQRRIPAIRSAFAAANTLWPMLRGLLDGRYYTTRPGAILLAEASGDLGARALVDRFNFGLRNVLAKAATIWQMTYKDPIDRINRSLSQAARETGRTREALSAGLDRLITARHALERNVWGTRLRAPMPFTERKARDAIVADWRDGKINKTEMAARIDALQTPEVLRSGMEEHVTSVLGQAFDPALHPFMPDDARYAGRDLTPALARLEIERLTNDPAIKALEARTAPDVQALRANILSMQRATGYDPHGYSSLFADTYVPIRPQGELPGRSDYERITLEFGVSTARMQGLGDRMASTGQIETLINLSRRAAADNTNQSALVDFVEILQRLSRFDGRLVRVLDRNEAFDATHDATIAVIRNIGRFGGRADEGPQRSGLDKTMIVRDRDGQLGGAKGDFYEVIVRDANIVRELQLTKPEEAGFLSTARFALRTAQGAMTHYNPGFLARNAWNDLQQAVMSGTKYGVAGEVAKHASRMFADLGTRTGTSDLRALRAYMMGTPTERAAFMSGAYQHGSPEYWVQAFVANGGHMVFESLSSAPAETVQARDAVDWAQRRAETSHNAVAEKVAAGMETFKKGTELLENISRLALFRALVEKGVDPTAPADTPRGFAMDRAAAESKTLTLDFHHVSPLGRALGALYAFANPSIADLHASVSNRIWKGGKPPTEMVRQPDGTYRETFKEGWVKELDGSYLKTRAALMIGQVMLLGAVLSPAEWEKVTLEDIANQWYLPGDLFGTPGQAVRMSKNYGVDRLIDAAIAVPVLAYFGRPDVDRMARDLFNVTVKNLSPGIDLNLREETPVLLDMLRAAMPTLGQPAVDFASGVDRFGRQTRPSDFYRDSPAYRATTMAANPLFADMARSLYRNNIGNWTGDQVQQLLHDYSTMIPLSRIFTDFALAFGRQSAQAEVNEATGRPDLAPAAQFINSMGGPVAFRDATLTPEAELARIHRDHVQPVLQGRADAQQQDLEAKQAPKGRRSDTLDLAQMGPRERAYMQDRRSAMSLLQIERDFKRQKEEARNAMLAARAQGDGPGFVRAATAYRRVSEQMVGKMKAVLAR